MNIELELLKKRVIDLEEDIKNLRAAIQVLSTFKPTVIDLRIKGFVRPIQLFAREIEVTPPTFTIVPPQS